VGEQGANLAPGSLLCDLLDLDAFEAYHYAFKEWKSLAPRKEVFFYEDFPRPISAPGIVSKILSVPPETVPETSLPVKQSRGDPLSLFANSDEIVRWYRRSSLQEIFPVPAPPRRPVGEGSTADKVDYLFVFDELAPEGLSPIQSSYVEAVRRALPHARIGAMFANGFRKEYIVKLPEHVRPVRFRNQLIPSASEMQALRETLQDARPSVLHLVDSNLYWDAVMACQAMSVKPPAIYISLAQKSPELRFLRDRLEDLSGVFLHCQDAVLNLRKTLRSSKLKTLYLPAGLPGNPSPGTGDPSRRKRVLLYFSDQEDPGMWWIGSVIAGKAPEFEFHVRSRWAGAAKWPSNVVIPPDQSGKVAVGDYDALIWIDNWKGVPNVVFDAFSAGVPVIAPDMGANRELICEETGYLVSHFAAVQEYVDSLTEIRDRPDSVKRRVDLARNLLRRRHSEQKFAETLGAEVGLTRDQLLSAREAPSHEISPGI
jgi:hypothetical protein